MLTTQKHQARNALHAGHGQIKENEIKLRSTDKLFNQFVERARLDDL